MPNSHIFLIIMLVSHSICNGISSRISILSELVLTSCPGKLVQIKLSVKITSILVDFQIAKLDMISMLNFPCKN